MNAELLIILVLTTIIISILVGLRIYDYKIHEKERNFLELVENSNNILKIQMEEEQELLIKWLKEKRVKGYFSTKRNSFFSDKFLKSKINSILDEIGVLDIVELIDKFQIPDEFLGGFTRDHVSAEKGFWDQKGRKYMTYPAANQYLIKNLTSISEISLRELIYKIGGWSEENLLKILKDITESKQLRGFLDTNNNLYITYLQESTIENSKRWNIDIFNHFIKENFDNYTKLDINTLMEVFNISKEKTIDLIQESVSRKEIDAGISTESSIFSLLDLYEQLILDISTFTKLDLNSFSEEWKIPKEVLISKIKNLENFIIEGHFEEEYYLGDLKLEFLEGDLDFQSLSLKIGISKPNLGILIGEIFSSKNLIVIFKDNNLSYNKISHQIIENKEYFYCIKCINFFHYSDEEKMPLICPLCENKNLDFEQTLKDQPFIDPRLKGIVRDLKVFQQSGVLIKLESILSEIDLPEFEAIKALQDLIFREKITGKIDLVKKVFNTRVEKIYSKPHCFLCDKEMEKQEIFYSCQFCNLKYCQPCSFQVKDLDLKNCLLCGEKFPKV